MIAGWVPWLVSALLVFGVVAVPVGVGLMDRGPDWLTFVLTRGGVVLFVSGLVLAVGAVVAS